METQGRKVRLAINGFGRIGRLVFRAAFENPNIDIVLINDLGGAQASSYFLKHDTAFGNFKHDFYVDYDTFVFPDGRRIKVIVEKDVNHLPWGQWDVDVVAECTGLFTNAEQAKIHLDKGAKKVLISAPGKGSDVFYLVRGVNDDQYKGEKIVSNGSCTTNSMTAVVNELHKAFGVKKGLFCTVHSMTSDQRIVDAFHKDLRRGRAAPFNIVPTSTGAAKSVIKLIPELHGKLDGISYRVPTITGSVTDINLELNRGITKEQINGFLRELSNGRLKGILQYSEDELVSSDIVGNPHSGIVDGLSTQVVDGNMVKLVVWYDNEWGFSNRMVEVIELIGKHN